MEKIELTPEWIIIGANILFVAAFALLAYIGGSVLNSIRKDREEKDQ